MSTPVAVKKEVQRECLKFFVNKVHSVFEDVKASNKKYNKILLEFQDALKGISKWEAFPRKQLYDELVAQCDTVSFYLDVPAIYDCFLEIARMVWKEAYLLDDTVGKIQVQKNLLRIEQICLSCINERIADIDFTMPVQPYTYYKRDHDMENVKVETVEECDDEYDASDECGDNEYGDDECGDDEENEDEGDDIEENKKEDDTEGYDDEGDEDECVEYKNDASDDEGDKDEYNEDDNVDVGDSENKEDEENIKDIVQEEYENVDSRVDHTEDDAADSEIHSLVDDHVSYTKHGNQDAEENDHLDSTQGELASTEQHLQADVKVVVLPDIGIPKNPKDIVKVAKLNEQLIVKKKAVKNAFKSKRHGSFF